MKKTDYKLSSGNVFADLEVDAPEEALAKAELTVNLGDHRKARDSLRRLLPRSWASTSPRSPPCSEAS